MCFSANAGPRQVPWKLLVARRQAAAAGTQAITAALALKQDVVGALVQQLNQRATASLRRMTLQLGANALGFLLLADLACAFHVSFSDALNSLLAGVDMVASGDLSHRIEIKGRDELSDIGALVERMNLRLSAMDRRRDPRADRAVGSAGGKLGAADPRSGSAR